MPSLPPLPQPRLPADAADVGSATRAVPPEATPPLAAGQAHEAAGDYPAALAAYEVALAAAPNAHAAALAHMNRGNALQKLAATSTPASPNPASLALPPATTAALVAYDSAIALFCTLPFEQTPALRNSLGAAWLNRGHALLSAGDPAAAVDSFDHAIAVLRPLPLDENIHYRVNLAGAWTNLAHALLSPPLFAFPRATSSAQTALDLLASAAHTHPALAEMSLRAGRALVTALGELLVIAEAAHQTTTPLADAASDALDDGLALARAWERRGHTHLRPLAARLFRLGAQLYRIHQPHFLAEFLLENLAPPGAVGAFAHDPEFRATADEALAVALADLQRPRLLLAGTPDSEKLLATAHSLRAAHARLSTLPTQLSPSAS